MMRNRFATVGGVRLLIGLGQGLVLYLLALAATDETWPATERFLFAPMFLTALYAPLAALFGLNRMDARRLTGWTATVAVILVGLALHDVNRRLGAPDGGVMGWWSGKAIRPSPVLMIHAAIGLFIAHALVVAATEEGKAIARYSRYFDVAWKQGVQTVFAGVFVGIFWLILHLGAALFDMLHLSLFHETISKPWFYWPVTFLSLSAAIHLTDVAPGIIGGIRTVALVLLSWLLPILVLITAGFLVALTATSLTLLWNTRHGAEVVLTATAGLIILANAAYQQGPPRNGEEGHTPARILAWAGVAVGPLALALVGLAGYATLLRVSQYGWTTNRVIVAAIVFIAAVYAVGYTLAGPWKNTPRTRWEATNVAASFVILIVMLSLLSPVADPSRIAVTSQVARLEAGILAPEKFDFYALRFDGQRYGQEALGRLAASSDPQIREGAVAALKETNRWAARLLVKPRPLSPDEIAANITAHPNGHALPSTLLEIDFSKTGYLKPGCFTTRGQACDAVFLGKASDGMEIAVILDANKARPGVLVKVGTDGRWLVVGTLSVLCQEFRNALFNGSYAFLSPVISDIGIGGQHIHPHITDDPYRCKD